MAKERTPEQEVISRALKLPERKGFIGRRMAWRHGSWPFKWGFFTNWRGFNLSLGSIEEISEKNLTPKPVLNVSLDWRPFAFIIFWRGNRRVWIGDWEWKKSL